MRSEEAARSEPGAPGAATLGLGKGGGPGGEGAGEVRGRPAGTQRGARLAERSPRPSGPRGQRSGHPRSTGGLEWRRDGPPPGTGVRQPPGMLEASGRRAVASPAPDPGRRLQTPLNPAAHVPANFKVLARHARGGSPTRRNEFEPTAPPPTSRGRRKKGLGRGRGRPRLFPLCTGFLKMPRVSEVGGASLRTGCM